MGNHAVGRAMAAGARGFWIGNGDAPVTQERALEALDVIGEDFRGADAEFDDEFASMTPLAKLVALAFGATADETAALHGDGDGCEEADDMGDAWNRWYEGPYSRFSEHFGFG